MELTRNQFTILSALALAEEKLSQRQLEEKSALSLGTVNKIVREFTLAGWVSDSRITPAGLSVLEPYRAKRAIFIAAGFGTRLVPVTLNTPKPLVRVNGKRLIDGLIDACIAAGIEDIYIVRGYLAEQFDQLLYKYPNLHFLNNPAFNEANNISSAVVARELLENAYVFEADLLISNPGIITKYHYTSNYLAKKVDRTDDWCFIVKNGEIRELKVGGLDCYQEVGISYWDAPSGKKLSQHLAAAYDSPGGKEKYWDQVPLSMYPDEYHVEVRPCAFDDITEIDTFKELKAIDKSYDV